MADLLTLGDYAEIEAAFGDIEDTFFKYPITLNIRGKKLSKFNKSRAESYDTIPVNINALMVVDSRDKGAENIRTAQGAMDMTEGYFLIKYSTAESSGLIGLADEILINGETDTVTWNNVEMVILGVNPIAPNKDSFHFLKLHYQKSLKQNE
jgi:hypothetical protein